MFPILLLCFCNNINAQKVEDDSKWKSIILYQTTKSDVEKLFGKHFDTINKFRYVYKTENYNLIVSYSYGKCTDEENSGLDIPPDTVTNLYITFKKEILLSGLEPDMTKLKNVAAHFGTYVSDEKEDRLYGVSEDKIWVESIYMSSINSHGRKLLCQNKSNH